MMKFIPHLLFMNYENLIIKYSFITSSKDKNQYYLLKM